MSLRGISGIRHPEFPDEPEVQLLLGARLCTGNVPVILSGFYEIYLECYLSILAMWQLNWLTKSVIVLFRFNHERFLVACK